MKETSGETRQTWENNVKMDLKEIRPKGANLVQVRCKWQTLVNTIMMFGFHKRQTVFCSDGLLASQELVITSHYKFPCISVIQHLPNQDILYSVCIVLNFLKILIY
jgi:hypothetical protein